MNNPDTTVGELVERLLAERYVRNDRHGASIFEDVNPDGPEAAKLISSLQKEIDAYRRALEPFAKLARPKTWPDAPGETGPSLLDLMEGKDGTGELYLGTHFGTAREQTLYRDDFEQALAALSNTGGHNG